jgi:DNA-binding MarR family transcriptional regulator
MSRSGVRVISRIVNGASSVGQVGRFAGMSKQGASQLVDVLVARGDVERQPDADDRRRMMLALTERGWHAMGEIHDGIDRADAALTNALGADEMRRMRQSLDAGPHLATLGRSRS